MGVVRLRGCCWALFLMALTPLVYAKPLELLVYENSMPSLAYKDPKTGQIMGLVAQIMTASEAHTGQAVRIRFEGRQRAEQALYDGSADILLLHRSWAKYPDKLLFSDAVFEHSEYLYSMTPLFDAGDIEGYVRGKVICVHRELSYPKLQPFFDAGIAVENPVSSHTELLKMLANGRCHLASMSQYRVDWAAAQLAITDVVYRSAIAVHEAGLGIAVRREHADYLSAFNAFLTDFKRSGGLQRLTAQSLD